ncbi:mitochondrial ornithine carrier protein [Tilletia horrida]|nr:mitochondrial ornithine carrier protein [Tilletia horrida]
MSDSSPTKASDVVRFEEAGSSAKLSRATKDVLFGSLAGMVAKYFEHPFDLVKVRLQSQPHDRPPIYKGAVDCFRQTVSREGVLGLYRGISMPMLGATLENASLFVTYNSVQSLLLKWTGKAKAEDLSLSELGVAAAAAGAGASLVLTPVELVKCRMQVQAMGAELSAIAAASAAAPAQSPSQSHSRAYSTSTHSNTQSNSAAAAPAAGASLKSTRPAPIKYPGPIPIILSIVRQHGPLGLWLGQTGTLLRETGGGIAWFLTFEQCTRLILQSENARLAPGAAPLTKKDLGVLPLVGSGAAAGVAYNVVLFPADCVKSTMQTEYELRGGDANPNNRATGFVETARNIYRSRGIRGLYAGCALTCLRSAPSSALIFLLYNKLEQLADSYGL